MLKHERVLAALERREPDRVPTMDMMVEVENIYEILGKKPSAPSWIFAGGAASRVFDTLVAKGHPRFIVDKPMEELHPGPHRGRRPDGPRFGVGASYPHLGLQGFKDHSGFLRSPVRGAGRRPRQHTEPDVPRRGHRGHVWLAGVGEEKPASPAAGYVQSVLEALSPVRRRHLHLRELPRRALRGHLAGHGFREVRGGRARGTAFSWRR